MKIGDQYICVKENCTFAVGSIITIDSHISNISFSCVERPTLFSIDLMKFGFLVPHKTPFEQAMEEYNVEIS